KGYDHTYLLEDSQFYIADRTGSYKLLNTNETFSKNNYDIEQIYISYPYFGTNSLTYVYGKNTLETYYKNFLVKGEWITKENTENKINCLVVGDESKLGTSFSKTIQDKNYNFYVCGILSNKCKSFPTNYANHYSPPGQVFLDFDLHKTNYIINFDDVDFRHTETPYALIFCDKENEDCQKELGKYGDPITMQSIRENVKESAEYDPVRIFSSLAIGVGVMSLLSMICMMMLFVKENEKLFLTFYNLGIRKKHIFQICSYYHIYFFGVLILLSVLFTFVWPMLAGLYGMSLSFDYKNLLVTLFAFLVVYGINLFIFFQFLYNKGELNE
ncbi:MAG: hypothetical protein IJW82_03355, partial [Clostridia bacterium]|nr:hypothetical protein [Clostridia bacterium]